MMLHFQKLDVYQRSIEFLAVANRIRVQLPKGNADLAHELVPVLASPVRAAVQVSLLSAARQR